jgi:hypothetical protein
LPRSIQEDKKVRRNKTILNHWMVPGRKGNTQADVFLSSKSEAVGLLRFSLANIINVVLPGFKGILEVGYTGHTWEHLKYFDGTALGLQKMFSLSSSVFCQKRGIKLGPCLWKRSMVGMLKTRDLEWY